MFTQAGSFEMHLTTRDEMAKLYAELESLFQAMGIDSASARDKFKIPFLYKLYDDLYHNGNMG